MRRHLLPLSVLLLAASVHSPAQQLPVRTFTTADGLPHYDVNRIVRDSRGFLWFCTREGLSKYDGYTFSNFRGEHGLPSDAVTDLLETRNGAYWVATTRGVARFDPRGRPGTAAPLFTLVEPDFTTPGAAATTRLLEARDGTIWVGTQDGLHRLEQVNGREAIRPVEIGFPPGTVEQRTVADILEDRRGTIWVASPSGLYRRASDGTLRRYTTRQGLPSDDLSSLLEDHEGRLWASSRLFGLYRFAVDDSRQLTVDFARTEPELPTPWVFQLFEASDRRLWAATGLGLIEIPRGTDLTQRAHGYSIANGLSYSNITAVAEDLGGNLWLGTNTAGAMKIARSGFTSYSDWEGIKQISDIFEDRTGRLCFRGLVFGDARSTHHGRFGCVVSGRFEWFEWLPPAALTNGWVTERLTHQALSGEWWIGGGQGLFRYPAADHLASIASARPLAVYTPADGLASWQVYRLFEDSGGRIWVSTISSATQGLARWDPVSGRMRDMGGTPGLPSLETELPRSFAEDAAGQVWIGFNTGVARYKDGRFTWFGAAEGVPPGPVMDIHRDHAGRLWMAFEWSGLVRVDNPAAEPAFIKYTTAHGLSSNNAEIITEDSAGYIYVGGGRGIDRVEPWTDRIKHFTAADGLPDGRFRDGYLDRRRVLWFGLTSGLVRYEPPLEVEAEPPAVLITDLRIAGLSHPVSVLGERAVAPADLAPDQNDVQIDFVGLGFVTGDVLRYQYMLAGTTAEWSPAGEQRTVTFASLSPGRYTFRVRAVNSAGTVSAEPATVTFTILRPVWQRWWFLTAAAFVTGLAVFSFYRYRLTRLLEMANLRTRIATDLHDDIGADLTRIALLSEVARQTRDSGALVSIARIARESVSAMSDIVWAINPKRETLADLIRRMRQHAEELFTGCNVELVFRAPDAGEGLNLGVDIRRDLLLVFKEATNNAARHAQATRVVVDLRRDAGRLVLSVEDNGVGFDPALESDGQGLTSLRRRAARLKGTLEIASRAGRGTSVTLSIPV